MLFHSVKTGALFLKRDSRSSAIMLFSNALIMNAKRTDTQYDDLDRTNDAFKRISLTGQISNHDA